MLYLMKRFVITILLIALVFPAFAVGPHELAVLANKNSPSSILVATEYARIRKIPDCNIIYVTVPDEFVRPDPTISPEDFTKHIWKPAIQAIRDRGIGDHIAAFAYSVDFPIRIKTEPPMSVQGLTFTRNKLPDMKEVEGGVYSSPIFSGPEGPTAKYFPSQTLDVFSSWLGRDMPLPSMMLGYTGERGNDMDTVLGCLRTGVESDGTKPEGSIYYVESDDVRSKARMPQAPRAIKELTSLGVKAEVVKKLDPAPSVILGIMMGLSNVEPPMYGKYAPGSFCDHLTSHAGSFDTKWQTKLSRWIDAGATASAGTITEPRAIWMKFPNARLFGHQAAGCTMIESIYQSVRCPMQLVIVGEPLASPWASRCELTTQGLSSQVSGKVSFQASVRAESNAVYSIYATLLDGRTIALDASRSAANQFTIMLDTTAVSDGQHSLRIVARRGGTVRNQVFADRIITVDNRP